MKIQNIPHLKRVLTITPVIYIKLIWYIENLFGVTEKQVKTKSIAVTDRKGNVKLTDVSQMPIVDTNGNVQGTIMVLDDKSEIAGMKAEMERKDEEIESLIHLVCVRACFTVVTANYRKKLFPENKYISVTEPYAWTFLKNFADKELSNFKIY